MSTMRQIDVRGLSCPQPVLRTTQALRDLPAGALEVHLDAGTARDNVVRLAERAGWQVTEAEAPDGSLRLTLRK
jgi:tRNA 2-thiouridine synthesizing protein A